MGRYITRVFSLIFVVLIIPAEGSNSIREKNKITISTGAMEPGRKDREYRAIITAKGGSGEYSFSLCSGKLPKGINLSRNGSIAGIIDDSLGSYNFSVKVEDENRPDLYAAKEFILKVVQAQWTILLHQAYDNDFGYLCGADSAKVKHYENLEYVKSSDSNNDIEILILMDAYDTVPDPFGNISYLTDGYYRISGGTIKDDLIVPVEEIQSGRAKTATDFIDWAVSHYPALHYLYAVKSHGNGFQGIGFDRSSNQDSLTPRELEEITGHLMHKTGQKLDLFLADGCLMGSVELAYELRKNVRYLVASEEMGGFDNYHEFMQAIVNNHLISGLDLGVVICDSTYEFQTSIRGTTTTAVADLARSDRLYESIDRYAREVIAQIDANPGITQEFNRAAAEGYSMHFDGMGPDNIHDHYYIDFGQYLDNIISNPLISRQVKAAAITVKGEYNNIIVYEKNNYELLIKQNIWLQFTNLHPSGLYIFHNIWGSQYLLTPSLYRSGLAFGENSWCVMTEKMLSLEPSPAPDRYEPDNDTRENMLRNRISLGETRNHTLHYDYLKGKADSDYIILNLADEIPLGSIIVFETFQWTIPTDTCMVIDDYTDLSFHRNLAMDDNSGEEPYSRITWHYTDPDIRMIRIWIRSKNRYGDYSINIRLKE